MKPIFVILFPSSFEAEKATSLKEKLICDNYTDNYFLFIERNTVDEWDLKIMNNQTEAVLTGQFSINGNDIKVVTERAFKRINSHDRIN